MGILIFPLMALLPFMPAPKTPDHVLANFSRFSGAIGQEISVVDIDGTVREGVLVSASASGVTMRFGPNERVFNRDVIASAERLKDGRVDGAIKGAIFGFVMGALASQGARSDSEASKIALTSTAIYSGVGWVIDAAQDHRQTLYRAPASQPGVKLSIRF
jgi:hypothetical protein